MLEQDRVTEMLLEHSKHIAKIGESLNSAHKRISNNDEMVKSIIELAANVKNLTMQVKSLAEELKSGLKDQGKRIGESESAIITHNNAIANIGARVDTIYSRVDELRQEPAHKWKNVSWIAISLAATSIATYFITRILS